MSYHAVEPDGSVRFPMGDATGRLTYDEGGRMSGQVMRPDRPAPGGGAGERDLRAVCAGYIAYFGSYELAEDGGMVVHHVEGALDPRWVGGDQVRRVRFDGSDLILEADVPRAGEQERHVLRWRRL